MKKRPFLMATLCIGAIFLFFLLVVVSVGMISGRSVVVPVGEKIGILEVYGPITDARSLRKQIKGYRENQTIKAVVLRIDSPGGGVAPSQELYAALKKLAAEKPLIVSMGSVAASGGYYLAVAGQHLFANPGSITGSIGVIMSFPDYRELMDKVGVRAEVVKSGRFKDIGSSFRKFSAEDRELLQNMIDDVHAQFVEAISEGRNMPVDRLRPYIDGRIFTGRQALEIGLIDELGTFDDAIKYAARKAGLGEDPDLVYPEPEHVNFIERLIQGAVSRYLGVNLQKRVTMGPQYLWNGY